MPGGLPMLLLDAAELAGDAVRGGVPSGNKDLVAVIEKKRDAVEKQKIQAELQLMEIEKFHRELTGEPRKEASTIFTWVGL